MAAEAHNRKPVSSHHSRHHKQRVTTISLSAISSSTMASYSISPSASSSPVGPTYTPYPIPSPTNYTKFISALNAGLLNPMSPPPPPLDKTNLTRSSPTLFDMMANEQDYQPRQQQQQQQQQQIIPIPNSNPPPPIQDRQLVLQDRIAEIFASCSPGNQFNRADSADVRLTLSSKDGLSVSLNVHRHILVAHSRFFAAKLSDLWSKHQPSLPHLF